MKTETEIEASREKFEERAFNAYFVSTIQETGLGGPMHFMAVDCKPMDEFCAKNPDGTYVLETLDSAWWGWRMALQHGL